MRSKLLLTLCNRSATALAVSLVFGIVALAIPVHAQPSVTDDQEQITVSAPPFTVHRTQGPQRQYRLLVPERVSVSRSVSYADLMLSRPADVAEFKRRIEETARQVCEELDRHVPRSPFDIVLDPDCVKTTTERAMASARRVMAGLG